MSKRRDPSRARYQLYGLIFLVVAAVFFATTIGIYAKVFRGFVPVSVEADRVGNQMRVGADVKVRGAVVGDVRDIRQTGGGAVLELALDPEYVELIPAAVSARLLPKTLFGERYVALDAPEDAGNGTLAAGDVIPQDRTRSTIEIEKVLNDLMPVLQAVQPHKLSTTLSAISQAVRGRGEQAGETLVQLNDYLRKLDPALPDLEQMLGRIDDVTATYADAAPDLLTALEDLSVTSRTAVQHREQIATMVSSLTTTSTNATKFVAANKENFILRVLRRFMNVSENYDGSKLKTIENGKKVWTPMIIVFAEGAMQSQTADIGKICAEHEKLSHISTEHLTSSQIAEIIEVLSGHETRATVLGYIQRGGSPSGRDRILAGRLGSRAVELLRDDQGGLAVGERGNRIIEVPLSDVQIGEHAADTEIADLINVMAVMTKYK